MQLRIDWRLCLGLLFRLLRWGGYAVLGLLWGAAVTGMVVGTLYGIQPVQQLALVCALNAMGLQLLAGVWPMTVLIRWLPHVFLTRK